MGHHQCMQNQKLICLTWSLSRDLNNKIFLTDSIKRVLCSSLFGKMAAAPSSSSASFSGSYVSANTDLRRVAKRLTNGSVDGEKHIQMYLCGYTKWKMRYVKHHYANAKSNIITPRHHRYPIEHWTTTIVTCTWTVDKNDFRRTVAILSNHIL